MQGGSVSSYNLKQLLYIYNFKKHVYIIIILYIVSLNHLCISYSTLYIQCNTCFNAAPWWGVMVGIT